MRHGTGTAAAVAAVLALEGCCNGPFVYVDCTIARMEITAVDGQGEPVPLVDARLWFDGEVVDEAQCDAGCDDGHITVHPPGPDGTYEVELSLASGETVTAEFDVVTPERERGACCSDVFAGELELVVVEASPDGT